MSESDGKYSIRNNSHFTLVDTKYIHRTGYLLLTGTDEYISDQRCIWALPLPENLDYSASWDWEKSNINTIKDSIGNSNWEDAFNQLLVLGEDTMETIPFSMRNDMMKTVHRQMVDHRTRNLNMKLFFSGQPKQEFTLSFNIIPFSQDYQKEMEVAVQQLYTFSTPALDDSRAFWNLPAKFQSSVYPPGENAPKIMTRPPFVIKQVQFTNNETSTSTDGTPISYKLTLQCLEYDFITKKDRNSIFNAAY